MNRKELLRSTKCILQGIQLSLHDIVQREKEMRLLTDLQLAKQLNISQQRLKQIHNGEFNGKLSQLIEIALKLGYTPEIKFNHPIFTEN